MDKIVKFRARRATVGLATALFTAIVITQSARAAEFIPLGSLPGDRFNSRALGVSDDGRVVVGEGHVFPGERPVGFVWTRETGMQNINDVIDGEPNFLSVVDVSGDGSTFVGHYQISGPMFESGMYRWSQAAGLLTIADVDNDHDIETHHHPASVSTDGSAFVGYVHEAILDRTEAFRYSDAGGLELLGYLPGGSMESQALGISANGSVVVGVSDSEISELEAFRWQGSQLEPLDARNEFEPVSRAEALSPDGGTVVGQVLSVQTGRAFRWAEESGMELLPELAGGIAPSIALDVSSNGSTIIGLTRNDGPFIWSADSGSRFLHDVFVTDLGLGDAISEWSISGATAISANGHHIVGVGVNPDGNVEAWLVTIPEPTSASAGIVGLICFLQHIRRLRRRGPQCTDITT